MAALLLFLMLYPQPDRAELAPPAWEWGGHVPATRNPYLAEIFTGPRGGKYWVTSGGRKRYIHN